MSCPSVIMQQRPYEPAGLRAASSYKAVASACPEGSAILTERRASALAPFRHGHRNDVVRRQVAWEDLVIAVLLPLPHANRAAQVLACILWIGRPIEIRKFDSAAVREVANRKIECKCKLAHFVRLVGLRLRKHLGEQRPSG